MGSTPGAGPVLVTGATGGVGSIAVGILAARGYEVVASTGKQEAAAYLRGLGATDVIDRAELSGEGGKPLESMVWAAAVDCVGGRTLANVLGQDPLRRSGGGERADRRRRPRHDGAAVHPAQRGAARGRFRADCDRSPALGLELLGGEMKPNGLESIANDVTLDGLSDALDTILAGGATGSNGRRRPFRLIVPPSRDRRAAWQECGVRCRHHRLVLRRTVLSWFDDDRSRRQELDVGARARSARNAASTRRRPTSHGWERRSVP